MAILSVRHVTSYASRGPIRLGERRLSLRLRDSNDQRWLGASLQIDREPARRRWIHDVFDKGVAGADFEGQTGRLHVESRIDADDPDLRNQGGPRLRSPGRQGAPGPETHRAFAGWPKLRGDRASVAQMTNKQDL